MSNDYEHERETHNRHEIDAGNVNKDEYGKKHIIFLKCTARQMRYRCAGCAGINKKTHKTITLLPFSNPKK